MHDDSLRFPHSRPTRPVKFIFLGIIVQQHIAGKWNEMFLADPIPVRREPAIMIAGFLAKKFASINNRRASAFLGTEPCMDANNNSSNTNNLKDTELFVSPHYPSILYRSVLQSRTCYPALTTVVRNVDDPQEKEQ